VLDEFKQAFQGLQSIDEAIVVAWRRLNAVLVHASLTRRFISFGRGYRP